MANYTVGPGQQYADLQSLASKLQPGDVVDVYGKSTAYAGGVLFTQSGTATSKITIRGVRVNGARPIISGGANTIEFQGNHYVFQGFDVTGGSSRVIYHHADDIYIGDTVVHDCPAQGILGAETDSGSLTLDYVEVHHCGSGTTYHSIYMDIDLDTYPNAVFRMQHSYVHDGLGGNNVKSRAVRNEIYYNWIEGAYYREIELIGRSENPNNIRMDSDVVGNVFVKKGSNTNYYTARIGGDGDGDTSGRYRFVNNTFVLASNTSDAVVQVFDQVQTLEMHNNVFYRVGGSGVKIYDDSSATWVNGSATMSGQNNWASTGSTAIPTAWTGTKSGSDPGFNAIATDDVTLKSGAAAINAGTATPTSPANYPFPNGLMPPAWLPPLHTVEALSGAAARGAVGTIDIGAYEYGSATAPPAGTPDGGTTGGGSMDGGVVTPPANKPPKVTLTSSASGTVNAPATIKLTATASDSDGTVSEVEFLSNGVVIATAAGTPYTYTWTSMSVGTYSLTARATDNAGAQTTSTAVSVSVVTPPAAVCSTATAGAAWPHHAFTANYGTVSVQGDFTPSATTDDAAVALSKGAQTTWSGLAAIVLFNSSGKIVARTGGTYTAAKIAYQANVTYHVRIVANLVTHTYSAYVRAPGGMEQTIGTNLAFRTEQAAVSYLDNWTIASDAGSLKGCGLTP